MIVLITKTLCHKKYLATTPVKADISHEMFSYLSVYEFPHYAPVDWLKREQFQFIDIYCVNFYSVNLM